MGKNPGLNPTRPGKLGSFTIFYRNNKNLLIIIFLFSLKECFQFRSNWWLMNFQQWSLVLAYDNFNLYLYYYTVYLFYYQTPTLTASLFNYLIEEMWKQQLQFILHTLSALLELQKPKNLKPLNSINMVISTQQYNKKKSIGI